MKNSKDISACITDLEFENYIKNSLSNSEKNRIEQHCSFCEMCTDSLEGLILLEKNKLYDSQKAKLVLAEGGKKVNMWVYFSAAASIIIILGISIFFINQSEELKLSSNEINLNKTQINEPRTEVSATTIESTATSADQVVKNIESKIAQESNKPVETIDLTKDKTISEIASVKSQVREDEAKISRESIKNLQIQTEALPLDIKSESEDLATKEITSKNEESLDDSKTPALEKKNTDVLAIENKQKVPTNFSNHTKASGASPSAPSYTSPANSFNFNIDNSSARLEEIQVVSTSKKRMQKTDSRMNERESELLKIKAAENFITQKSYDKAIGQLERVIKSKSNSEYYSKALWLKAICLKNLNNTVEANKILNELISKNPAYSKIAQDSLNQWNK
jgi:tetratricopeptide (TPR) repeat protein